MASPLLIPLISVGLQAAGSIFSFKQAKEQRDREREAQRDAAKALEEARVQLIPGSLIQGGEGHVRVSYATDESQIIEGIERLKSWLT